MFQFSALFFLLSVASCTAQKKINTTVLHEAAVLKQLEYESIAAEFRLDTASISRIMHDDFVAVYPDKLQNKLQELTGIYNTMVKRQKEGETMDSLYLDDFTAKIYNNTAVVTFFTVTKGRAKGVPYENRRMRWYDVWIKERGQWKFIASQGTPIPAAGK